MADEGGEKTEMPTAKKLRDARQKGQVCTSKDIVSTALLVVLMYLAALLSTVLVDDIEQLIAFIGRVAASPHAGHAVRQAGVEAVTVICKHSFIFVCVAAVVGVVANVAQIGFLFTGEPLKPSLNKLNPAEGFKRIFSMKNLFEFLKNCVKVTFLSYLIWKLMLASYPELLALCYGTMDDIMPCLAVIMKRLAGYTAFGYIVIAVVDRLFQQKNFTKQMMMTKDEVKREYKEMEGSAEVKQAQRQFRDEILNGPDPVQATKESSVVVTNPTHLAVGISYKPEVAPVPMVMIIGADKVAAIIRRTAVEEGIPITENVPLARRLYAEAKVGAFVPISLVEPVAQVLKWVKSLNEARKEEDALDSVLLTDLGGTDEAPSENTEAEAE
ncbi:MAG: type III secretion system export apparatus subunit SctU [Kiritimatiellae bacterium]|nr:type III secretion system export apparatus subunit SctU [Kiritimatiellia bacterium]